MARLGVMYHLASALVLKHELHRRVAEGRCAVLLATHALDIVLHYASGAALSVSSWVSWGSGLSSSWLHKGAETAAVDRREEMRCGCKNAMDRGRCSWVKP